MTNSELSQTGGLLADNWRASLLQGPVFSASPPVPPVPYRTGNWQWRNGPRGFDQQTGIEVSYAHDTDRPPFRALAPVRPFAGHRPDHGAHHDHRAPCGLFRWPPRTSSGQRSGSKRGSRGAFTARKYVCFPRCIRAMAPVRQSGSHRRTKLSRGIVPLLSLCRPYVARACAREAPRWGRSLARGWVPGGTGKTGDRSQRCRLTQTTLAPEIGKQKRKFRKKYSGKPVRGCAVAGNSSRAIFGDRGRFSGIAGIFAYVVGALRSVVAAVLLRKIGDVACLIRSAIR